MSRYLLLSLLFCLSSPSVAQLLVRGKIFCQSDKKPIPFANVGIRGRNVGTISNEDGTFSIRVPNERKNDTLIVSALGYGKRIIPFNAIDLKREFVVYLRERAIDLQAITVSAATEDLVKFGNALLHSSYFDPTLVKDFVESQFTSDDTPTGYGLGWYVSHDRNGHRIWYHAGDLLNSSAFLVIYPDDDIVVAFLANSQQGLLLDIQQIGALFYQQ